MRKEYIQKIWKSTWPHLVAVLVFATLVMVYFAPQVFDGKQLPQGDMVSFAGMGYDAKVYHDLTGEDAHWSNSMFCGMPYNVTSGIKSKSVFAPFSGWTRVGFNGNTTGALWLLLLGFYVFMLAAGCSPWLGIVGAVAFAFGSYNLIIIDAGHVTKAWVLATVPAVIGGCLLCYNRKYIAGFIVALIATGLNVYWNHQQISYYTIVMLLPLAVSYFIYTIREKEQKHFWLASMGLVIAAVMAVAPAVDKLVPTWDYSKETMRGGAVLHGAADSEAGKSGLNRDYAFMWSYGKAETMTLLIPNFYGGGSGYPLGEKSETYKTVKKYAGGSQAKQFVRSVPTYWGDQPFTSGPVYAGAVICFLFILGLMVVPQKERWWLLAVAVIGIVLSWGRNFPMVNNWLFDHLPLYNKFRTPSMSLVMTTTAMAMMGMLALKEVVGRRVSLKQAGIAGGITAGLCMLFVLDPGLAGPFTAQVDAQMPDWLVGSIIEDRRHLLTADAWRSTVFVLLACACVAAYLKAEKMKSAVVVAIVGVLILADLWTVDKHFLNDSHFVPKKQQLISMTDADRQILQDKDPDYRVLNLASNTFNESKTSYYHKSVGGYSPAKLRRYQDIIDYYFSGRINMNVVNMLNTRYVITQQGVRYNPEAFGNAWFVNGVKWVDTPNEEIEAIGDADLKKVAFMDTCWQSKVRGANVMTQPAKITLTNYANPGNLFYESESTEDGIAVFSEVYYKTWRAFIDGEEVPVLRANYILRALEIPAGKHTIEFRCEDRLLLKTQVWSVVASVLVVLAVLGLMILALFRRRR
ncbi:MAG: YfhO family protein [Paludibacteraceae bacterium]|nr:YfhO family protein [Paludibacteraceae bacterium]